MTTLLDLDREIDETEIGWLLSKRASAVKARDADYLVSRLAPGSTSFDLTPPLNAHRSAVTDAAGLRDWFDGFEDSIEYSVRDLTVVVGDDVAFAHSIDRFTATPVGGRRFQLWLRVTTGLRRTRGVWLITHEHRSVAAPPE
ncbi:nuclear transport factor 2 family protein [Leifsonia sp. YIM 134122]|uniref:Nuclear transport factor 2 family protein n=1 Tax=Leifsonia stereocauli TaxID=3134136 RepID=A0ABU9W6U6_9MICO